MQKRLILKWLLRNGFLGVVSGISLPAFAGGFQLFEESASQLGNAFAGTGASAEDASTEFYNPAGMTLLKNPQFVVAGTALHLNVKSHIDQATNTSADTITGFGTLTASAPVSGNPDTQAGGWNLIPAMHFVYPHGKWALGFGITAPYGLETNYPETSMARFLATDSRLTTVNIGPSFAYQLTPKLSLGVGFDAQYFTTTLNQQVDLLIVNPHNPTQYGLYEGSLKNQGDDWGYGWNAGALYQFSPATRVGLTYRSKVDHSVTGDASINVPNPYINLDYVGTVNGAVTLPASTDLSFYHDFNPTWTMLAGIDYTQWSQLSSVTLNYGSDISHVIQSATLPLNFRDTLRYALGANYHMNNKWSFRSGVAFDESPARSANTRTFRLPDANRVWVALGAQYKINSQFTLDAGYAHLFISNSSIDQSLTTNGTLSGGTPIPVQYQQVYNAIGTFTSSVNEFGLQLTWNLI